MAPKKVYDEFGNYKGEIRDERDHNYSDNGGAGCGILLIIPFIFVFPYTLMLEPNLDLWKFTWSLDWLYNYHFYLFNLAFYVSFIYLFTFLEAFWKKYIHNKENATHVIYIFESPYTTYIFTTISFSLFFYYLAKFHLSDTFFISIPLCLAISLGFLYIAIEENQQTRNNIFKIAIVICLGAAFFIFNSKIPKYYNQNSTFSALNEESSFLISTKSTVNIRENPGVQSLIIKKATNGEVVFYNNDSTSIDGSIWYSVKWTDEIEWKGWINKKYLIRRE